MKIAKLEFENNVFLAPMAGVTDIVFRGICKDMGCGLVYTEMVSSKGLFYGSENTEKLLQVSEEEKPVAVQLFGNDPYIMAKACEMFSDNDDICVIDINMGCPVPKIVKNGEGSALMRNPKLAQDIIKEMKKATPKPVTVKFRKGFNSNEVNAVEFAKAMEEAGVDAIAVHGRTREQMYEGKADWEIIRKVKNSVSVPVIGNGDVFSVESAVSISETTGCDGIMVARGVMGNPWLFREIKQALEGNQVVYPTDAEKINMCIRHLKSAIHYFGEDKAVREMRKHIGWYVKGLKNCAELKNSVNIEKNSNNVIEILLSYKQAL